MQPEALVVKCVQVQGLKGSLQVEACCVLSCMHQLEATFRQFAPRKAAGPDRLPPDLGRLFSCNVAELFWPVLLKSVLQSAEAVGYKGSICRTGFLSPTAAMS